MKLKALLSDRRRLLLLLLLVAGLVGWVRPLFLPKRRGTRFRIKKLVVESKDKTPLVMRLYVPGRRGPHPAALVLHGCRANWKVCEDYALALAAQGFIVGAPDLRGHGGSAGAHGNWGEMLGDVKVALATLQAETEAHDRRTVVLGHSMGAGLAGALAFERPELAGVVAVGGGAPARPARFPTNLLLATGSRDRLMPPDDVREAGRLFTGRDLDFGRTYGSFAERSAIRLMRSDSTHLGECFDPRIVRAAAAWCRRSVGELGRPRRAANVDSRWIMLLQFASGILLLWALGALVSAKRGDDRRPHPAISVLRAVGLFAVFFLLLVTTVSARFYDLGPHRLRAAQYAIVGGVLLPLLVAAIWAGRALPRLAGFGRGFALDAAFVAVSLGVLLGVSAAIWKGLFPFWPLILACLLVGHLLVAGVLTLARVHLRERLAFAALSLTWLFVATVPGY
jgi:dienelactone hydrolase